MNLKFECVLLILFCIVVKEHLIDAVEENSAENDEIRLNLRFRRGTTAQTQCNYTYAPYQSSCDICGNVSYTQNSRIVGGTSAVAYSWPAQVYITHTIQGTYYIAGRYYDVSKTYVCGGTLINRHTVLTAAHCINTEFEATIGLFTYTVSVSQPYDPTAYKVYVGIYDTSFLNSGSSPSYPGVKMSVYKVIRHPNFNSNNYLNDAALLLLSKPAELNQYVQIACLPNPSYGSYPPFNVNVYASGWGTLIEGGSSPSILYNVKILTYNATQYCKNVEVTFTKNWDAQICAGSYTGGKDTCQGDSGGGLYVYDTNLNKYVVVGITSYGEGCARYGKPGIYTRVSYYYDWITTNWATTGDAEKVVKNMITIFSLLCISIFIIFHSPY